MIGLERAEREGEPRRARRRARLTVLGVLVVVAMVAMLAPSGARTPVAQADSSASASAPTSGDSFQPQIGLPALGVVAFGSSPAATSATGAPVAGEAWAFGTLANAPATSGSETIAGDQPVLMQRTDADGWQDIQLPLGASGAPLRLGDGAQNGRATPDGGVALLDNAGDLVTVDPGSTQASLAPTPSPALLPAPQTIGPPGDDVTVPFAAVDDAGGRTGVLVAPNGQTGSAYDVLHYDGTDWSAETVAVPSTDSSFTPEALACGPALNGSSQATDSPDNCWLLASVTGLSGPTLTLFGRVPAGQGLYTWVPETVPGLLSGTVSNTTISPLPDPAAQMLTVTSQGLWVDFSVTASGGTPQVSELIAPGGVNAGTGAPTLAAATSPGTWCTATVSGYCTGSLPADFPSGYLSFSWPGTGGALPTRIITGGSDGSLFEFAGGATVDFTQDVGTGGTDNGDINTGAAFTSPTEGWITTDYHAGNGGGADGEGEPQVVNVAPGLAATDALTADPVPFGSPLLAVAAAPGSTPGDPNGGAFAVGVDGEIAQYVPGAGWTPQVLLNGAGEVQTPTLRGVAWPEAGRAYAVGDNGAMWLWESATDQWEPDPAKPFNFDGNLTGIAFAPGDPDLGYAVGKQGTLLQFGKTWTQVPLPTTLQNVDFTSITFAGSTALATYRQIIPDANSSLTEPIESGGLAVNTGSGWVPDANANALLANTSVFPYQADGVLSKVAGLADGQGQAVAAGPGVVIESNDVAADVWSAAPQPLPIAQNISALGAYEQSDNTVGAIVSADLDSDLNPNLVAGGDEPTGGVSPAYTNDVPYTGGAGQPPAIVAPDPLPDSGYLLQQTATGWVDMEHETYPEGDSDAVGDTDVPMRPDPVLGLLVAPNGSEGLAVGGQTGNANGSNETAVNKSSETAGISRFGAGAGTETQTGPPGTITTDPTEASFALGGDAACVTTCAEEAGQSLAPDVSLTHALDEAGNITGVRGFLFSGGRLPEGANASDAALDPELYRERQLLASGPKSLPVYAAPSADVAGPGDDLSSFLGNLSPFDPGPNGISGDPTGAAGYYAFTSPGTSTSGPVMVIVLDFSSPSGTISPTQFAWLNSELAQAKNVAHIPAIVMGSDALGFTLPDRGIGPQPQEANPATATTVSAALVNGGASAYLFDYPQANVQTAVTSGSSSIPAFGSGTLGYVTPPQTGQTDSLGSSAMLIVSVKTAARNALTNVAPVTAVAVPNIGQLAMDATGGTLLRRSQVALFDGLARRPAEGSEWTVDAAAGTNVFDGPEPYDPIPNNCQGNNCAFAIPEQYSFSSSSPSIGNFVEHDAASSNPYAVALGSNNLPVADPASGLFCAFNAGSTTVSLTAGGLTYSLPVTVTAGSVEYPCGTVRATMGVITSNGNASVSVNPIHSPTPVVHHTVGHQKIRVPHKPHAVITHTRVPTPVAHVKPPPVAVTVVPPPVAPIHHQAPLPVVPFAPGGPAPIHESFPPPPASVARPVPPSGASQVPSSTSVAENVPGVEREREKLAATQGVDAMSAHDPDAPLPIPAWSLGLIVLAAALGGAGLRRRGPRELAYAGRQPRAGQGARARTWHRPPPTVTPPPRRRW